MFRTNRLCEGALSAAFDFGEDLRLSPAALETLAIVAYLQPVSRPEIAEIRGVNSDSAVQTLVDRELILETGRRDDAGGAILFGTTRRFQVAFGLDGLEQTPGSRGVRAGRGRAGRAETPLGSARIAGVIMRLQRALAAAGLGSRRACEDLIRAGRVTVDGVVAELGMSVDPDRQALAVDGRAVRSEHKEYWLLNKAAGVVSTVSDPQGRETVVDCVPAGVRVYPVGRLDQFTTGLLLLTNDGDLANRLLHPRYGVGKEYRALVRGHIDDRDLHRLRDGVQLDDGPTAPASVRLVVAR